MYIDEINNNNPEETKKKRLIHPERDPNFITAEDGELMYSLGYVATDVSYGAIEAYIAEAAFERYWNDEQKNVLFQAIKTISEKTYIFSREDLANALEISGQFKSEYEIQRMIIDAFYLDHIESAGEENKYKPDERQKRAMMPFDDWDRNGEIIINPMHKKQVQCKKLIADTLCETDLFNKLKSNEQQGLAALLAKVALRSSTSTSSAAKCRSTNTTTTAKVSASSYGLAFEDWWEYSRAKELGLIREELRALKILLKRADGEEENPPIIQGEQYEILHLMARARSPGG
jgi:hypothetical protein